MTAIKTIPLAALALVMMFTVADATAQCRTFTKKRCLPALEDYVQNDNYNTAVLIPGDEAELELTFFGDRAYRLLVCGHPVLGDLTFQVLDSRGNGIYDSSDKEKDHFRFQGSQYPANDDPCSGSPQGSCDSARRLRQHYGWL